MVGSKYISDVWLLLRPPADPTSSSSVVLIRCCHMSIFVIFHKRVKFIVIKVMLKILVINKGY